MNRTLAYTTGKLLREYDGALQEITPTSKRLICDMREIQNVEWAVEAWCEENDVACPIFEDEGVGQVATDVSEELSGV